MQTKRLTARGRPAAGRSCGPGQRKGQGWVWRHQHAGVDTAAWGAVSLPPPQKDSHPMPPPAAVRTQSTRCGRGPPPGCARTQHPRSPQTPSRSGPALGTPAHVQTGASCEDTSCEAGLLAGRRPAQPGARMWASGSHRCQICSRALACACGSASPLTPPRQDAPWLLSHLPGQTSTPPPAPRPSQPAWLIVMRAS
jgi:hypothetical protein